MSEERFIIVKSIENFYALVDKEREDKEQILIFSLHKEQLGVVCDVLNEQQAIINEQSEQHMSRLNELIDENSELRMKIVEQQATINELKAQLKQKEQEERLYANEILKLNKEAKEVLDFKSLGGDY